MGLGSPSGPTLGSSNIRSYSGEVLLDLFQLSRLLEMFRGGCNPMIRGRLATGVGLMWIVLTAWAGPGNLWASLQAEQQKPAYSLAEYDAYKAADAEQNPQEKIKQLDDFV